MSHRITLIVATDKLATVISALEGSAQIKEIVEITDQLPAAAKLVKGKRRQRAVAAKAANETQLGRHLMSVLKGGRKVKLTDLMKACESAHFAPASASPAVGALVKAGFVERVGEGVYQIKPQATLPLNGSGH